MMILLDTNVAIWSILKSDRLPEDIIKQIKDKRNEVLVSSISVWEVAIKSMKSPKSIPIDENIFVSCCVKMEFKILPLKIKHINGIRDLKIKKKGFIHKDPFDKMIISQSVSENMKLYTSDKIFGNYNYNNIEVI